MFPKSKFPSSVITNIVQQFSVSRNTWELVNDNIWLEWSVSTVCVSWKAAFIYIYIYIYAFSRRFYPKRLTLHSSYSFYILSALAFPGNRTHDLGVASAMLYQLSYRKDDLFIWKSISFHLNVMYKEKHKSKYQNIERWRISSIQTSKQTHKQINKQINNNYCYYYILSKKVYQFFCFHKREYKAAS